MKRLNIVADENIPALDDYFSEYANITRLPGRAICQKDLIHADALIVRSITRVDAELLHNTAVKFVGTCTIGVDHIDVDYLAQQQITFTSAPGCNADAVVNYVISCLFDRYKHLATIQSKTIAVLGYGQVGRRLVAVLNALSIPVIACDPFVSSSFATASFEAVLSCDAISIHTPITTAQQSTHPTHYLFNEAILQRLKPDAFLINAARGKVVDNAALLALLLQRKQEKENFSAVLDVYDEEPSPKLSLLDNLQISTSHIAGYSVQGKLRGTSMVAQQLFKHFKLPQTNDELLADTVIKIDAASIDSIPDLIHCAYDVQADSNAFQTYYRKAAIGENNHLKLDDDKAAILFDQYRKTYAQRYEWGFTQLEQLKPELHDVAKQLGFMVI